MNDPASLAPIDPQQIALLCRSICDKFGQIEFEQILMTYGGTSPAAVTTSTDYTEIVMAVIEDAQQSGWMSKLLAALSYGQEKTSFGSFVGKMGRLYAGERSFQSLLIDVDGLFDWSVMMRRAAIISRHVCLISIDNVATGTGVLVGPDLILTNHHVVTSLIQAGAIVPNSAERLTLTFDFLSQVQANGRLNINPGKSVGAAAQWLVACSVPHASEIAGAYPADTVNPVVELDYALLRAESSLGTDMLPDGSVRSWAALKAPARPLDVMQIVHISQHAAGQALKGASGRISTIPPHKARVRYQATTLKVSSGSPCWDNDFQLIALHNVGGISCNWGVENQGIPIDRIIAHLKSSVTSDIVALPLPDDRAGPAYLDKKSPPIIWSVGGDYPVLSRPGLIRAMVALMVDDGSQVLLVNGARFSGRSFTVRVVQQFLRPAGHLALTVPATALMDKSPEQVLMELRSTLGLGAPSDTIGSAFTTRPAEVGRHLLGAFLLQLRRLYPSKLDTGATPTQIWIVFDGLDQITLADETHDLLAEMSRRVGEVPTLRLVFTGYERALPAEVEATAEREQIAGPTVEDIHMHLRQAAEATPQWKDTDDLRQFAVELLAAASIDPAKRMADIGLKVRDMVRAIREQSSS